MSWNESALVCEEKSEVSARASEPMDEPAAHSILINIDKSTQQMTVFLDGVQKYDWPISTGKRGYSTPSGTFAALSMNEIWYSKEWENAYAACHFLHEGRARYPRELRGEASRPACVAWLRAH